MASANSRWKKLPNPVFLNILYRDMNYTLDQIAHIYDTSAPRIARKLKRDGFSIKSYSERLGKHIYLHKGLVDFLDGLLLGDGSLILCRKKRTACYCHTDKNKDYMDWLAKAFDMLGLNGQYSIRNEKGKYWMLRSSYAPELKKLWERWYHSGKKCVPIDFELSPTKLFNWFIGDGCFTKGVGGTHKSEKVRIGMTYDIEGRQMLMDNLKRLGIDNSLHSGQNIYINASSRIAFYQYMRRAPYEIPACYLYKFPEVYYAD